MNVSFLQEICQSFAEVLLNVSKPIKPFIPSVHTCMYLIYASYFFSVIHFFPTHWKECGMVEPRGETVL